MVGVFNKVLESFGKVWNWEYLNKLNNRSSKAEWVILWRIAHLAIMVSSPSSGSSGKISSSVMLELLKYLSEESEEKCELLLSNILLPFPSKLLETIFSVTRGIVDFGVNNEQSSSFSLLDENKVAIERAACFLRRYRVLFDDLLKCWEFKLHNFNINVKELILL